MSGLGRVLRGRSNRDHQTKKLGDFASLPRPSSGPPGPVLPGRPKPRSRGRVSDNPPIRHSPELGTTPLFCFWSRPGVLTFVAVPPVHPISKSFSGMGMSFPFAPFVELTHELAQ